MDLDRSQKRILIYQFWLNRKFTDLELKVNGQLELKVNGHVLSKVNGLLKFPLNGLFEKEHLILIQNLLFVRIRSDFLSLVMAVYFQRILQLIVYYRRPFTLRPYTFQKNCFCCGLICIIQLEINKQACRVLLNSVVIIGFCGNGVKDAVWHVKRNSKKTDLIFPHHQIQNKHIGTVSATWCPHFSNMTSQ